MMLRSDIDLYLALRDDINSDLDHACEYYNNRRQELGLKCDEYHQWVNNDDWNIEDYLGDKTIVSHWTFYGSRGYSEEMISNIPLNAIVEPNYIDKILNKEFETEKRKRELAEDALFKKKQEEREAKRALYEQLKKEFEE